MTWLVWMSNWPLTDETKMPATKSASATSPTRTGLVERAGVSAGVVVTEPGGAILWCRIFHRLIRLLVPTLHR